jgi:DNA-directed RNA polymerase subunit D
MIKLIEKSEEKIAFNTDMPVSLANAIRRSVNYIPTLAIDSVEISKNDSALYDEVIGHRLGLLPLKNEDLKMPSECDCGKEEGCGKCSMKFKLSMGGPCVVYSDQISPKGNILYKMPITMLGEGQELEFVAVARMGLGKNHAKYIPGLFNYRYSEDLEKDDDVSFNKIIEESKKEENKELRVLIESWGTMPAKKIFTNAVEVLDKEIGVLIKKVK